MSDGDDLLQKADALMRRHRAPETGEAEKDAPAEPADESDVPLLTEVVDEAGHALAAPKYEAMDVAALRSALACELEAWLDQELPQHVMRVLDGITDQLVIQLSLKARAELLPRLQALVEAAAQPPAAQD